MIGLADFRQQLRKNLPVMFARRLAGKLFRKPASQELGCFAASLDISQKQGAEDNLSAGVIRSICLGLARPQCLGLLFQFGNPLID